MFTTFGTGDMNYFVEKNKQKLYVFYSIFWQILSNFPEILNTMRADSAIDESGRVSRKIENLVENLAKNAFRTKMGPENVFWPNFRPNFRFFVKFGRIRQSHYQPALCSKFQENSIIFAKKCFFCSTNA